MPQVRAFHRIVLSLSLAIPQFGLLSHVSFFRLSSGHSGLVLTLSMQPTPPCSAPTCLWWMQAQGLLVRHVICGFYLFMYLFFLLVMLPSEIPKLPTDPLARGFPGVWKLLLLHNSLPGTGLHP